MRPIPNKKVFLIHGFKGAPNDGWRPYLMRELERRNIYTYSLSMPNPNEPKLDEWMDEIGRCVENNPSDDIYLVGHSLGGTSILRYLEKFNPKNIKGIITVSAPCKQNIYKKNDNFLDREFDWEAIKNKVQKIVVVHGDNDPIVSLDDGKTISSELGCELVTIPNGLHLNGPAGFIELPEVLAEIVEMIQ